MASTPEHALRRLSWHRPAVALFHSLAMVFTGVWLSLQFGRDTPWDYFSYHAYSAHLLFHDRLAQDYFAGGMQGYMNPIGFLPFALASAVGMDSIGIGAMLGAFHALNGVFLLLICRSLSRTQPDLSAVLAPGLLLGIVSPILLMHLGSTFTDPIGSVCVLGAVWLALKRRPWQYFGAGVFIAAAIAIKLSNLVFAVALVVMVLFPSKGRAWREWLRSGAVFASGSVTGLAIFQGVWSWRLYTLTGNPLFPFFNGLLKSPLIPVDSQSVGRFVPKSILEFLAVPLDLARYSSWSHLEIPAPTLVPLAATAAAIAFAFCVGMRRLRGQDTTLPAGPLPAGLVSLGAFCLVSAVLWTLTSGNSRYALPLFLLLGPLLALLLIALVPRRYAILVAWLVLAAQIFMTVDARIIRWRSQQWTPQWVSVDMPRELASEPALFISLASQSQSNLVPYLHPRSSYIHLNNGHFSVPSTGAGSVPLWRLLRRHDYRAKIVLQRPRFLDGDEVPLASVLKYGNSYLDRISMRIVDGSCSELRVNAAPGYGISLNAGLAPPRSQGLVVCDAVRSPSRYAEPRAAAERIMNAFEDKCPGLFNPRRPQIELAGEAWVRIYPKYDSAILVVNFIKGYVSYQLTGQFKGIVIGTPSTWKQDLKRFDCRMPYDGARGYKGFAAEVEARGR